MIGNKILTPSETVRAVADGVYDWFAAGKGPGLGQYCAVPPKMESRLHPYRKLFEPVSINSLVIPNRIVMGPMGNVGMAEPGGRPGERMAKYFAARASGGTGLLVSGMTPVSMKLDPSYADRDGTSIFPRLDGSRPVFSGWKRVAEEVQAFGSRFFVQLAPGMGRVGSPECLVKKFKLPVSASWNPNWYLPQIPCRPLTDAEVWRIIKATGSAALDLRELGIDGVELHGHSGYLIEQMTDRAYNRRKTGAWREPRRFGVAMAKEIRKRCGPRFPIIYRLDMSLALRETWGKRMDGESSLKKFRNGRTAEQTIAFILDLVGAGVDAIDVDLGGYESWWLPHPPNGMPPAVYTSLSEMVKTALAGIKSRAGFPIPVIVSGKMGFPDLAEQALLDGKCDMITLARPLLADPDWPLKVREGRVAEIRPCIGDHEGCLGQLMTGGSPHCSVNPRATFEHTADATTPPIRKKKIAVIGAGPAGIAAALESARRGHDVTLFEASKRVGGMLVPGSRPAVKYEIANYISWLENEIAKAQAQGSLRLLLNTTVIPQTLAEHGSFDEILLCAGAKPILPNISILQGSRTVQAVDLLADPSLLGDARTVVIAGGSDVGCETASWLKLELGIGVSIVEMLPELMAKSCHSNRGYLIHQLERAGVTVLVNSVVSAVSPGMATVDRLIAKDRHDPMAVWKPLLPPNIANPFAKKLIGKRVREMIAADLVIFACGLKTDDKLYGLFAAAFPSITVRTLGDCFKTGRVLEAVKAGYETGRNL